MTTDDKIRDGKLEYDINRKAAKISALPSGKIDISVCLTGGEILPSSRIQVIEQVKRVDPALGKALERQA